MKSVNTTLPPAPSEDLSDAALLLVGHGSTLNADSAAPTHLHAEALRRGGLFAEVAVCFWKEHPVLSAGLRQVSAARVFVVPLFISDGYFTEQVIPRELGFCVDGETHWARTRRRGGQTLHYCDPVGTHPSMTGVILARATAVVAATATADPTDPPPPAPQNCSLFIAGHGTGNNEHSRRAIEAQVALIAGRNIYRDVHAIFMEEEPRIGSAVTRAQTGNVVIVPFFIADGLHSYEDIPRMLGVPEAELRARLGRGEPTWRNPTRREGKRIWYSRSVGDEPHLPDVILERVREAAGRPG